MESTFDTGLGGGRKATIFGVIVAFHALLVWALLTSLGTIIVDRLPPIIKAEIIEELADDEEPPPPPPTIETPPPYVPPPDILIDVPVDAPPSTGALVVSSKPAPPPPPVQTGIKIAPKVDKRFASRMKPEYPPTSRRLNEEGLVVIECLVGVDGKCQEVKLKTSSGFPRLDEATLKHAPRAWKFTPGTEDGKPAPQWITVPVRFKVTD